MTSSSFEANVKLAVVLKDGSGGRVAMDVSGAVVSGGRTIVQVWLAGGSSTPQELVAMTSNSWLPSSRPERSNGDVHGA